MNEFITTQPKKRKSSYESSNSLELRTAAGMMTNGAPPQAQAYIEGQFYKIGLRGWPFVWAHGQWYRSMKSASEVQLSIEKQAVAIRDYRRQKQGKRI